MIIFLDLKGQITEGETSFAFYDTVTDRVMEFGPDKDQVFDSLEDFRETYDGDDIERFTQFIPRGFFNAKGDIVGVIVDHGGLRSLLELRLKEEAERIMCEALSIHLGRDIGKDEVLTDVVPENDYLVFVARWEDKKFGVLRRSTEENTITLTFSFEG